MLQGNKVFKRFKYFFCGFLIIFIMIILFFLIYYYYSVNSKKQIILNGDGYIYLEKDEGVAYIGGPFELIDQHGNVCNNIDFINKYMLIYFGYIFCPDICPTALYNITYAMEKLGSKAKIIQPIFISVDPERDTKDKLKLYMENFHSSFLALTGTHEQIEKIKSSYHVYSSKAQISELDDNFTEYLIDHTSIIYLMDTKGKFISHFNHQTSPEVMARYLEKIIN